MWSNTKEPCTGDSAHGSAVFAPKTEKWNKMGFKTEEAVSNWMCASNPQASAALPRIRPIFSHQEVDLSSHFHVVDPPAGFVALPLSTAARLLIVSSSLNVLNEPIHGKDSV